MIPRCGPSVSRSPLPTGRARSRSTSSARACCCGLAEYTPEWIRAHAEATYDRCYYPEGADRHMAAVRRAPDRTPGLRQVNVPTAVFHGLTGGRLASFFGGGGRPLLPRR